MNDEKSEDEPLNAMLPNPYGLNEYPGRGSVQYRSNRGRRSIRNRKTGTFGKYGPSLRTLIPIRTNRKNNGVIPVDNIGCLSTVLFSWISPLMWKGYRQGLEANDVYKCPLTDGCFSNGARLTKLWQKELERKGPENASLIRVLFRFLKTRLILQCVIFTIVIVLGVLAPAYFMLNILDYIEKGVGGTMLGIGWALGLTLVELSRTTIMTGLWSIALRSATRLRSAVMHLLYIKIFKIADHNKNSIGQLVNMFGNDAATVYDAPLFIPLIIGGPLMIIAGIIYVYIILGPMSLVGMSMFLIFFPLQAGISKFIGKFRKQTMKIKDKRSNRMTELLTCIKLIKLYAWEHSFKKKIDDIRTEERKYIGRGQFLQSISLSLAPAVPILAAFVTFVVHIAVGGDLTSAQAFTTLTLYYIIGMAIRNLPHELKTVIHTKISLNRIKAVLTLPELDQYICRLDLDSPDDVVVCDASLTWDLHKAGSNLVIWQKDEHERMNRKQRSDDPMLGDEFDFDAEPEDNSGDALNNIDLKVKKGSLVAVIGPTGCGKSSLLSALIGKMALLKGKISIGGACAYVSQIPWIMNGTLRENILLNEEFDAKWYYQVLHSCELTDDISKLPGGDNTHVGDRGVKLSGGQRLRVCLARSVYNRRDIYLLDDCFSAIDQTVSMKIFSNVIRRILADKTVILITHNVQFLEYCDEVVVLRSGRITDVGPHKQLLQTSSSYTSLIEAFENLQQSTEENTPSPLLVSGVTENKMANDLNTDSMTETDGSEDDDDDDDSIISEQMVTAERVEKGRISWYTYKKYIQKSGGYLLAVIVLLTLAINIGFGTFSSWWLSEWLSAGNGSGIICWNDTDTCENHIGDNPDISYYQTIYALTVGFVIVTNIFRAIIFTKATLAAGTGMHNELFKKVIESPMKFFDNTPIGRILNLFTKDQEVVDCRLPLRIEILLQYLLIILFALVVVIAVIPWMFLVITLFAVLFYYIYKIFHHSIRDIKRLQNVSWPIVFSHVATSMQGIDTIRVYNKQDAFVERFDRLYDQCSAPLYLYNSANRWIGIRLEMIAICITMVTAILTVVLRDKISPPYAGLALSYTVQFCTYFQYMVRTLSQTEAEFTSFERQLSHSEALQSEEKQQDESSLATKNASGAANENSPGWGLSKGAWSETWPTRGRVSFQNVSMRYQPCLLPVLKSVTFDVFPGEKIGIVGRTGAGKSSLGVVLFRLVEISSGLIYIDGIDISLLSLHQLRSRLCIIPQDPVLFQGTIRDNLDPNNIYSDSQLWKALEKSFLKSKIVALGGHLRAVVDENGRNFSVGQRQLLCLSRAILRNSKVILLDEATASIDIETSTLIQRTLNECFEKSTVLTIAHRLHTIKDCNRILVLHNGTVAEFDEPAKLLVNPRSRFSAMVASSSLE